MALAGEALAATLAEWRARWPELVVLDGLVGEETVHLVGGTVRDLLLGRQPKDTDLVVANGALPLARRLARQLRAALVPLHDAPPTARVVLADGRTIDLAEWRGGDLVADLWGRDFTVNALAIALRPVLAAGVGPVIDPTGGQADLAAGLIRMVAAEALVTDPLRMLRAYRLMAVFGWRLTLATRQQVQQQGGLLRRAARERVASELITILASRRAVVVLRAMVADGLLAVALPPLARGAALGASWAGPWRVLARLQRLQRRPAAVVGAALGGALAKWLATPLAGGRPRRVVLSWLTLALGWGRRPRARPVRGRVRALARALVAGRQEERLALSIEATLARTDPLTWPVPSGQTRERLAELGEATPGALLLAWASQPPTVVGTAQLRALLGYYWTVVVPALAEPPLVDGATLIASLELAPGPLVGRLLAMIRSAQLRGEIDTPAAALALARRWRGGADATWRERTIE